MIKGKDGKILKLARGGDARYMLAVDAILSVDPRRQGEGGRRHRAYLRPKAPRPATSPAVCRGWPSCSRRAGRRTAAIIAEISGTVRFGRDYKNKRRITIEPIDKTRRPAST